MTGNEKGENLRKKVESFIKEKIKVNVEVKYARKIGTFEQKASIMENKKILGRNVYRK